MPPKNRPIFKCHDLKLDGDAPLEVGTLSVEGPRLALWDAAQRLLRAFVEPQVIARGTISLGEEPPAESLKAGRAAYLPRRLPLAPNVRLEEAIVLSGQLLGLPKSDARRALQRCRMEAHAKKRLGELTRLQMRLSCLAHGLLGNPELLIMENLYEDLDEAESAIVEALIDVELEGRQLIAATSSRDPASRALARQCDRALAVAGNLVLPPAAPSELEVEGHWVQVSGDATALATRLTDDGGRVTVSPKASVLLVRQVSGSAIYRAALDAGLAVIELTPTGFERDSA